MGCALPFLKQEGELKLILIMSIKKFVVVAALALALVVGVSAAKTQAASFDLGSTTLKLGSTGLYVQNLQANLNADASAGLTVDGDFGHGTLTAVEAFQASHGLTADGEVGNMTKAALANAGSMSTSTSCPAGFTCTSTNPVTTVTCPAGFTCVSNSTGASSSTTGPLSINQVTASSGYSQTNVGVGATNTQVADLRIVTGAGGSGTLTGLNVTFTNLGYGDFQFTKYASSVSVWMNGVQIGSLSAGNFTEYNSAYSAYIPLTGGTLNPSTTNDLYIAVSGLPVIDSSNLTLAANYWALSGVSLRYSDSTGSAFQYSLNNTGTVTDASNTTTTNSISGALPNTSFTFNTAASASSIALDVVKDQSDQTNHSVQVSTSTNTQNVTLATIDLDPQNSAVTLARLPVTIGVVNTGSNDISNVINTVSLYNSAGVQIDSEPIVSATTSCSGFTGSSLYSTSNATCEAVTFQNFNTTGTNNGVSGITLPAGSTNVFTIKANVNSLNGGTFAAGTYAVAELTQNNVLAIQAYDSNDNLLPQNTTYLVGSTTGSQVAFYSNGINVTSTGSSTYSYTAPGGQQSNGLFTMSIPFAVSSYGGTSYVPHLAAAVTSGTITAPSVTATSAIQFEVDNGTSLLSGATGTIQPTGNNNLTVDGNGNYQIPVGQTEDFNLIVTYSPTTAGSYSARLANVNYNTSDSRDRKSVV